MGTRLPLQFEIIADSREPLALGLPLSKLKWLGLGAVALLYVSSVSSRWHVGSDSALYLLLAESLAQGHGYTLWGRPHVFVPPGYPMILATLMRVGVGDMYWLNLSMIVLGLLALCLTYKAIREQAPIELALLVALTVAVSREMHVHSVAQLSDVPFMVLVWCGLWCYTRGLKGGRCWLEVGTVALISCCWVRVVGIPLASATVIGVVLQPRLASKRRVWLNAIGLAGGILLTVGLFCVWHRSGRGDLPAASYADEVWKLRERAMLSWCWQPAVNFYETGSPLARMLTGQSVPPALALLVFWLPTVLGLCRYLQRREYIGVAATAGYIGAILLLRPLISRYLLPVAPLLTLYFLEGVRWTCSVHSKWRSYAPRVAVACAGLLMLVNLPKDIRLVLQAHLPKYEELCNPSWPKIQEAADSLRREAAPGERFLCSSDQRQLAYLSHVPFLDLGLSVLQRRPAEAELLETLERNRVNLVVFADGGSHPYFAMLKEMVSNEHEFMSVFDNGRFEIYRRIGNGSCAQQ